ncbi:MAG TPA: MarR family transcriptional regulator [Solirubrobacteraceae bacterium]|nr:MarR family transcriptional regulator [Solirubrobacteraceae bacterium]
MPAIAPALDTETATRLRAAIGRLSRQLRTTAAGRAAGLAPTGISVLLNADRNSPLRLSELASSEGVNPTMLSRVVAGMVQDGLLLRSSDEGDRRAAWVSVTPKGHKLAERMRRERTDAINTALSGLTEDDCRRIERALPALEALGQELKERRP